MKPTGEVVEIRREDAAPHWLFPFAAGLAVLRFFMVCPPSNDGEVSLRIGFAFQYLPMLAVFLTAAFAAFLVWLSFARIRYQYLYAATALLSQSAVASFFLLPSAPFFDVVTFFYCIGVLLFDLHFVDDIRKCLPRWSRRLHEGDVVHVEEKKRDY